MDFGGILLHARVTARYIRPAKCSFAYCSHACVSLATTDNIKLALPFTLAGFPTFAPITFHLLASYSLIAASSASLCHCINKDAITHRRIVLPHRQQNPHSACPHARLGCVALDWSHVTHLVPMLLHTSFRTVWKCLTTPRQPPSTHITWDLYFCYLTPTVPCIPHRLKALLFCGTPWRVGPALFRGWSLRGFGRLFTLLRLCLIS